MRPNKNAIEERKKKNNPENHHKLCGGILVSWFLCRIVPLINTKLSSLSSKPIVSALSIFSDHEWLSKQNCSLYILILGKRFYKIGIHF